MSLLYNELLRASGSIVREGQSVISLWLVQRRSATSFCYQPTQLETHVVVTQQQLLESHCAWILMGHSIMGYISGLFQ